MPPNNSNISGLTTARLLQQETLNEHIIPPTTSARDNLNRTTDIIDNNGIYPVELKERDFLSTSRAEIDIFTLLLNDYSVSLSPDITYRETNKAAQRNPIAPDRIGQGKTWVYQREDCGHYYGKAEHFTERDPQNLSPKDNYIVHSINIPDYELSAEVYNIRVTAPSGQEEFFKALINLDHLKQTLERRNLTYVQKSRCEVITPEKPGEVIYHAFNASYNQIRKKLPELAQCYYGYIQIPPVTFFRADGPATPENEKNLWYHAYQPEDLCTIHNPMGDLQDFIALVKDARKFNIDIIPDYTFNFMGKGGSGKDDLNYPSADIRERIAEDIESGIPGYWQGQVFIPFIEAPKTKLCCQIHPEEIHMTSECFEQDYGDIKDDEWSNHEVLIRKRLSNMPKTTPECDRVIALENTYVHNMRKLGVFGLRYDAAKHSSHEQIKKSISPPVKNIKRRSHITNLFDTEDQDIPVMSYIEYIVSNTSDAQNLTSLLQEMDHLRAIDFERLMILLEALKFNGDIRLLAPILVSNLSFDKYVFMTINHDIPNNNETFLHLMFRALRDEILAMAFLTALSYGRLLVYDDGQELTSTTEIRNSDGTIRAGGEAWINGGLSPSQKLFNEFHSLFREKPGIWYEFRGALSTKNVLAFSRGNLLDINEGPHDGLVIINKGLESVDSIWQTPLQPGKYKNMGCDTVTVINDKYSSAQDIPPGEIFNTSGKNLHISVPGRSAILLGKTGELPDIR
ncbi:alpha-amylase family glycosyl hydrolase [Escherichia albertii]|uniref:alpha amylase C-terminal domain-containing protein n=1 Tax=Escherichia albertii TaxID=208962 RepID=UPI00235E876E|nr:alpha-amylase family glycosyl hydrolase [Escherichia albertii]WDC17614.1 alpha-amylase family glycosyl hydrolase [Escherichia albertii]